MKTARRAGLAWAVMCLVCSTALAQSEPEGTGGEGGGGSGEAPDAVAPGGDEAAPSGEEAAPEPPDGQDEREAPAAPPAAPPAPPAAHVAAGEEEPGEVEAHAAAGDEEHGEGDADHAAAEEHSAGGDPWGHHPTRLRVGDPDRVEFSFGGEYALRITGQGAMRLSEVPTDREDPDENLLGPVTADGDPNELGQEMYLYHWLRIRPELRFLGQARLVAQADLLHGHVAGDDTRYVEAARDTRADQQGVSSHGFRFRYLYLEWMTPIGVLRAGQMGSYWGMGLLANDGDHQNDYLFGDHHYGDIVERLVFLTKPFLRLTQHPIRELAFFVGGDVVFDDGIANLLEGDLAWQIVGGLLWRLDPERAIGLYIAYRNQTYEDGDFLEVTAIDLYAQWSLRLADGISGYAEGEVVGVVGSTNAAPNLQFLEQDVRQLGFALRVGLRLERLGLDVRVEGGYASGDADTGDDRIGRFTMDPDFRVGLILFPELFGWSTARMADLGAHEGLVGEPQEGLELLPTNGSVAGAGYVYPSLRWRPLDWLDVRVAVLIAQGTADVVSPFETKRRGQGASFRGGPATSRDLGVEVDVGVDARWNLSWVQLRGGVEAGYFVPGRAFDDAEGNPHDDIWLVRGRLMLEW
jgi:hypothetical protein